MFDPREVERRQISLYELSKEPGWRVLLECIQEVVGQYACELPSTPENKVKWETFSTVSFVANKIVAHLQAEISAGAQLSQLELAGDKHDAEADGPDGDRRTRA